MKNLREEDNNSNKFQELDIQQHGGADYIS